MQVLRTIRVLSGQIFLFMTTLSAPSPFRYVPIATRTRTMFFVISSFTAGLLVGRFLSTSTTCTSSPKHLSEVLASADPCPEELLAPPSLNANGTALVPSPAEASYRFAKANAEGSDKTSVHAYHVMYGHFLAPYLREPVVSFLLQRVAHT